jgi:hypothetical protein
MSSNRAAHRQVSMRQIPVLCCKSDCSFGTCPSSLTVSDALTNADSFDALSGGVIDGVGDRCRGADFAEFANPVRPTHPMEMLVDTKLVILVVAPERDDLRSNKPTPN